MSKNSISRKLQTKISKYMSYILRHNPMELKLDEEGYANLEKFLDLIQNRFKGISRDNILMVAKENERYEIKGYKIKAIYGHSIDINYKLEKVTAEKLYHGTTQEAANVILKEGLKAMGRNKVHLSTTIEQAIRVGKRRAKNPTILIIDAQSAINENIKFEKASDKVFLADYIPAKFIKILNN